MELRLKIRKVRPLFAKLTFSLILASRLAAAPPGIPDYKIGETATADIVAPVHLIVVDPERTEQLRQQERSDGPPVFRFDLSAAEAAEAKLRAAFEAVRAQFLDALEASYAKRSLSETAVTYPRFQRFVASFQRQTNAFSVSTNLAQMWAIGASDEPMLGHWTAPLREVMGYPIRPEVLSSEVSDGPAQVRLVTIRSSESGLSELGTTNLALAGFYTLARARRELQSLFPEDEQEMAKFVVAFLKENCTFDARLTGENQKRLAQRIWVADEYEPGQLVLKRGDRIDARLKAVLGQLRERAAADQARLEIAQERREARDAQDAAAKLHTEAARAQAAAREAAEFASERNRWLGWGLASCAIALLWVLWRMVHTRRAVSLLPVRVGHHTGPTTVVSCPACAGTIVVADGLRAAASLYGAKAPLELPGVAGVPQLAADRHPLHAEHALRAAIIPHLARLLAGKLVRRLSWHRRRLLDTQKKAERELEDLEQRLLSVQAPLADRLKAYEQRIAELENDLTAKGKQNEELIHHRDGPEEARSGALGGSGDLELTEGGSSRGSASFQPTGVGCWLRRACS